MSYSQKFGCKSKDNDNQKDRNEIKELENKGVVDCGEEKHCDIKLIVAADDIKEMQKDSSKFSKALSELV